MDTITYFVWPCGTYVEASEYNETEWAFMGDDYATTHINADIDECSDKFWELINNVTK